MNPPGRSYGLLATLALIAAGGADAGGSEKAAIPLNKHGVPLHACCETPRCCGTSGCCGKGEPGDGCTSKDCPKVPGAILAWRLTELSEEERAKVKDLDLRLHAITPEVEKAIASLPALEVLNLDGTDATDATLDAASKLPAIRTLFVKGTKVTREAADRFMKAKPRCKVYR